MKSIISEETLITSVLVFSIVNAGLGSILGLKFFILYWGLLWTFNIMTGGFADDMQETSD